MDVQGQCVVWTPKICSDRAAKGLPQQPSLLCFWGVHDEHPGEMACSFHWSHAALWCVQMTCWLQSGNSTWAGSRQDSFCLSRPSQESCCVFFQQGGDKLEWKYDVVVLDHTTGPRCREAWDPLWWDHRAWHWLGGPFCPLWTAILHSDFCLFLLFGWFVSNDSVVFSFQLLSVLVILGSVTSSVTSRDPLSTIECSAGLFYAAIVTCRSNTATTLYSHMITAGQFVTRFAQTHEAWFIPGCQCIIRVVIHCDPGHTILVVILVFVFVIRVAFIVRKETLFHSTKAKTQVATKCC